MMSSVDTPSAAWTLRKPALDLIATLDAGTEAMRKAGVLYLPKEDKESDTAYAARLNCTTLFPGYRRTIDTLVGKPLEKQIQLSEDTPKNIADWLNNVDLTGRGVDVFARDVFRDGLNDGMTHLLVDFPEVDNPGNETLADERAANRRPYIVHVNTRNLLGFKSALTGGQRRLTQVRILEISEEDDPQNEFASVEVRRVRVLEPGRVRLYKQTSDKQWMLEKDARVSLKEIPFVTVYSNRIGYLDARPPLIDLAYMNLAHWQSTSDQRTILHVARVPVLHIATTASPEDINKVTIGSSRAIITDKDTVIKFVEHTGAAIAAGQEDLNSLKDEMGNYGFEMISQPARVTATERVIDKQQNESSLSVMARGLKQGLMEAVRFMADWAGMSKEAELGDIDLRTDFKFQVDAEEARMLWNMRLNGDISQESFWFEMQRRGVLAESFDPEKEEVILAGEVKPIRAPLPGQVVPGTGEDEEGKKLPGEEEDEAGE